MAVAVLSSLVTYNKIRAQLGASSTVDLKDTDLDALDLDDELKSDLYNWFPNYQALIDESAPDAPMVAQLINLKLWVKWYSCHVIMESGPLRFIKSGGDSENKKERFAGDLTKMKAAMMVKADESKVKVLAIATSYSPTIAEEKTFTMVAKVAPLNDLIASGRGS